MARFRTGGVLKKPLIYIPYGVDNRTIFRNVFGMVSSPILFLLANFGWKDAVLHLITFHKQYANYLSLYCPFAGIKKAQGANQIWLTP